MSRRARRTAFLLTVVAVTACGSGTLHAMPTATAQTSAPSAAPSATATPMTTLASCRAAVDAGALHVVHRFDASPDDIAIDASGNLWVAETDVDRVVVLSQTGDLLATHAVPSAPEGIAIAGATVYVTEQNRNSVVTIAPSQTTFITLPNPTSNMGIDGIAIDSARSRMLVPDSPTGQLYAVPLTGTPTPQLLAANFGRPVDAAADAPGDLFVAAENSPGLTDLTTSGTRKEVGHFTDLDEVVPYGGLLYVTELDRHDVAAVDPATGASVVIATGLPAPQGLAITATGTLEIVDSTNDALYSMPACGVTG